MKSFLRLILKIVILCFIAALGWIGGTVYGIYTYPNQIFLNMQQNDNERGGRGDWFHLHRFLQANWRGSARPNQDAFYSSIFADLSESPVLLTIPAADKYYNAAIYAENTDIIAMISSRTHGLHKPHTVLIVPPRYKGETFGHEVIKSNTDKVWILVRFYVEGKKDYDKVRGMQYKLKLEKIYKE